MLMIIIPLGLLFGIALIKQIPKIGGDIRVALLAATISSAIISELTVWGMLVAMVDGIDRLAWVIMLSIFGSIYAETQVKIGSVDTTLFSLRAIFGRSSRGLIIAIFMTLIFAGSLLGDAIAAATVIGFLVIHALSELRLKPEQIGMIILLGSSIGSIMPPITQGVFLSASLVNTDPSPVLHLAFLTVSVGAIIAVIESIRFVKNKKLPNDLIPTESLGQLLEARWTTLIPLFVLLIIVLTHTIFNYNIFTNFPVLSMISQLLMKVPIIQGVTFPVVSAIIVASIVSFLFTNVRNQAKKIVKDGIIRVHQTVQIQICAGMMVGVFYASGVIDQMAIMTQELSTSMVKIGGMLSVVIVGMMTGSQTTAQTVNITFLGPILENMHVDPTLIALGASHIAAAGQNMPPVGLTAFVICGLIGGILNQKVDPLRVMFLALPNSMYFLLVGLLVWFL
ncbi:TRAP transporter large permease subunit [Virgibacillus salexigens]|uniref:TRAP transporter large permease subunit n=1 Tax=Virgibacillus salexigens TaxID=61016 RepID=UPI003081CC2E